MDQVSRHEPLNKATFHQRLRAWLDNTDDFSIGPGPEEVQGRTPWVFVRDGSDLFGLNADTKRAGVRGYLELVAVHGDNLLWTIAPTQRGNMTAVVYGPEAKRIKPFYLYFVPALSN